MEQQKLNTKEKQDEVINKVISCFIDCTYLEAKSIMHILNKTFISSLPDYLDATRSALEFEQQE